MSFGRRKQGPAGQSDPYLLQGLLRGCKVLKAFRADGEALRLKDIVERTGLNKTMVFRVVRTLEAGGLLLRTDERGYRPAVHWLTGVHYRIGYAAQGGESAFSMMVSESIRRAAWQQRVDLVALDNRYSAKTALTNAERLISEHVSLVVEFQTFDSVAPIIAAKFREAGIPLIAVEIPHPGATYFGADNYQAGQIAGRAIANWAKHNWGGRVDELLMLDLVAAGPVPQLRLKGIEAAVREALPAMRPEAFVHLDTKGEFGPSFAAVRKRLRWAAQKRTLIAGINDNSVLGALRAFEEAGLASECAGIGFGATPEGRVEMRQKNTRLIGSIAFFPERYGEELIRLALDILAKKHVPTAVYTEHRLITPANLDRHYPAAEQPASRNT